MLSPPSHVACLIHRSVLLHIITALPSDRLELLLRLEPSPDMIIQSELVLTANCCCGMDGILELMRSSNWMDVERFHTNTSAVTMTEIICNMNSPMHWPEIDTILPRPNTFIMVGLCPDLTRRLVPNHLLEESYQLMAMTECVAFGEVGLDYKTYSKSEEMSLQRRYLHSVLPRVAACGKPLVLSYWSPERSPHAARRDLLIILEAHLTKDHPIYLHSFHDGILGLREWQKMFKCVHFGLGEHSINNELRQVITKIPLDRLLLESSEPYIEHNTERLPTVLKKIGAFVNLSPKMIGEQARCNARRFFSLP